MADDYLEAVDALVSAARAVWQSAIRVPALGVPTKSLVPDFQLEKLRAAVEKVDPPDGLTAEQLEAMQPIEPLKKR